jgi:hypothetical protein
MDAIITREGHNVKEKRKNGDDFYSTLSVSTDLGIFACPRKTTIYIKERKCAL